MIAILEAKRAGLLTRSHLWNNVLAGLVLGIVALPLAMAVAIASTELAPDLDLRRSD